MTWQHPRDRRKRQEPKPPIFSSKHWRECFATWLTTMAPTSAITREYVARQFFVDPNRAPDSYTTQEVYNFLSMRTKPPKGRGAPPSPNTRNMRLGTLKSFYSFAAGYDIPHKRGTKQTTKPLYATRPPTYNIRTLEAPAHSRAMSRETLDRFFAAIPRDTLRGKRDRALFLCYFWCARRLREICRLTWGDIEQDVTFNDGHKGVRYHWLGKGRVKKSEAEMPPDAWLAVVDYLKAADRWGNMTPDEPLFLAHDAAASYREQTFLNKTTINKIQRSIAKRAGLTSLEGVHDWRWTIVQIHFRKKRDLAEAQKLLDHKSPATTMRYLEGIFSDGDTVALELRSTYGHL
jgi:integrase